MPAASHYVLLFSAFREHRRGDVIPAAEIDTELERLINLQAVRPATEDESKFQQISLSQADSHHLGIEQRLVIRERELATARNELATVQAELNAMKAASTSASIDVTKVPSVMQSLADKNRVIGDLSAQLKVAQNQIQLLKSRGMKEAAVA